jgi:glycosyltransferase involved in cell wall biosynthesis
VTARPLRIVHVLPELVKGGGERVAIDLANHAVANGHEATILASYPTDPSLLPTAIDPRVSIRYLCQGQPSRFGRYLALPRWIRRNAGWLRGQDIVHCHMTLGSVVGAAVQLARRICGWRTPAVVETYHAVGVPIPHWHRSLHASLAARRDALALMAEDRYWRAFIDRRPGLPSQVIPNGVDFPDARPPAEAVEAYRRDEARIPDDSALVMGSVGRLAPARRPDLYIPIFADVARALGPDVHFLLAGAGPELGKVEALVARHGIDAQVHLPGVARDPALPMALMDLYISINVGPITGIAALEAAFSGLPVIAIQLRDDYLASERDWIWSSSDLDAVAAEALRLLRDPAARAALAERQNAFVRANHGVDVMARAYYALYEQALAARGAPQTGQGQER